jgi:hypothetical protein
MAIDDKVSVNYCGNIVVLLHAGPIPVNHPNRASTNTRKFHSIPVLPANSNTCSGQIVPINQSPSSRATPDGTSFGSRPTEIARQRPRNKLAIRWSLRVQQIAHPASMRRKSVAIERHPPGVVIGIGNLVPGERLAHLRARHEIDEEPESGRDCHHGPDGPDGP